MIKHINNSYSECKFYANRLNNAINNDIVAAQNNKYNIKSINKYANLL